MKRSFRCRVGSALTLLLAAVCAHAQSSAADLKLTETATPFAAPGGNITYTFTVANLGSIDAQGVQLTDQFAAGLAFQSIVASQGTGSVNGNNFLTFNIGTIAANGSANVTVVFTVDAATIVGTMITNGATATEFPTSDPDLANNIDTATTVVSVDADVDLTMTATPFVVPGGNIRYTITVTNHGPIGAQGVQITDQFATGLTFQSASPSQGSGVLNLATNFLTFNFGTIAANGSANILMVMKVDPATIAGTVITNGATVTEYPTTDPNLANNTDIAMSMVTTDLIFNNGFESGIGPALPAGWDPF